MESVVLTIHLILALLLIGVVLLQKNEGAALLSGGGNMQARGQATALTKLTWILAAAFIVTSIALTILATRGNTGSVVDGLMPPAPTQSAPATPDLSLPPAATDEPAAPPAPEAAAPAETAPAEAAPAETTPTEPAAPPAPATNP